MNIVVTGAGRGVGFSTVLKLAQDGGNTIFVIGRKEEHLLKLKQVVKQSNFQSEIIPVVMDLQSAESRNAGVQFIKSRVGTIEILINNAGLLIKKEFTELTEADWNSVYGTNVIGMALFTAGLMPLLQEGKLEKEKGVKAHIVNISSMGGVNGSSKFSGLSAYSSSKGAMITLTECIAEEQAGSGIRVNCLALGSVETEMFGTAFPGFKAALTPEDMGAYVADFSQKGHRFFNGKCLPVSFSTP